jgi:hypothetical protein
MLNYDVNSDANNIVLFLSRIIKLTGTLKKMDD